MTFPVQSAGGNRSIVVSTTDVITPLRTTKYSFAFWANYDVQQARTVSAAAMKNVAGKVVSPNSASVLSALRDYEASGQVTFDSLTLGTFYVCPSFHLPRGTTTPYRRHGRGQLAGGVLRLDNLPREHHDRLPRGRGAGRFPVLGPDVDDRRASG